MPASMGCGVVVQAVFVPVTIVQLLRLLILHAGSSSGRLLLVRLLCEMNVSARTIIDPEPMHV